MYKHCLTNSSNFACQAYQCVWQPRQTFLDNHILLVNFKNIFLTKNVCQAHIRVMTKLRQTLCLIEKSSNVCQTMFNRLAEALFVLQAKSPCQKGQTLKDKHVQFCLLSMLVRLATTTNIARQAAFACQFQKHFYLSQNVFQAHVCVMARLTNIVSLATTTNIA